MPEMLRYKSPIRYYQIHTHTPPVTVEAEGWQVTEKIQSCDEGKGTEKMFEYWLEAERAVGTTEKLHEQTGQFHSLADEFDRVWAYYGAFPFVASRLSLDSNVPRGWSGNYEEVSVSLQRLESPFIVHMKLGKTRHHAMVPALPLAMTDIVRIRYRKASEGIRALVDMHYNAMTAPHSNAQLLFYAKALELCASLLPGGTRKKKLAQLPPSIASSFKRPFEWLYEIANTRAEIRHIVATKHETCVHPSLSDEEHREFREGASVLIRFVICQGLSIDLHLWHPE